MNEDLVAAILGFLTSFVYVVVIVELVLPVNHDEWLIETKLTG